MTSLNVEDLSGAVAACSNEAAVAAESHTADDTRVGQVMHQLDIECARDAWVEDRIPVVAFAFQLGWEQLKRQVAKLIANVRYLVERANLLLLIWWRGRVRHCGGIVVRIRTSELGGSRSTMVCSEEGCSWLTRSR